MSAHLDKAKMALTEARDLTPGVDGHYDELLIIARIQAEVAQADALERLADLGEKLLAHLERDVTLSVVHG